jgi:hypothetical protein
VQRSEIGVSVEAGADTSYPAVVKGAECHDQAAQPAGSLFSRIILKERIPGAGEQTNKCCSGWENRES